MTSGQGSGAERRCGKWDLGLVNIDESVWKLSEKDCWVTLCLCSEELFVLENWAGNGGGKKDDERESERKHKILVITYAEDGEVKSKKTTCLI